MAKAVKKKILKKVKPAKVKVSEKSVLVKKKKKLAPAAKVIVRKTKPESNGSGRSAAAEVKAPPRKPMTAEMQNIRHRLLSMLTDLRKDIDHEVRGASERDLAHINDTSDMASDSAEGELSLRIAESETAEASEIERAIEKIDNGTYGICEMCNKEINAERLQFLPYVTMCIKCQELAEIRKRELGDELDDLAEGSDVDAENN